MENTSRLHDTLMEVYGQHDKWLDKRHLDAMVWMIIGLIWSGKISLTEWVTYRVTTALASSTQRRYSRWLQNKRIEVNSLYAPLIYQGWALMNHLLLDDQPDPLPAISSRKQWLNLPSLRFKITFFDYSPPGAPDCLGTPACQALAS